MFFELLSSHAVGAGASEIIELTKSGRELQWRRDVLQLVESIH